MTEGDILPPASLPVPPDTSLSFPTSILVIPDRPALSFPTFLIGNPDIGNPDMPFDARSCVPINQNSLAFTHR